MNFVCRNCEEEKPSGFFYPMKRKNKNGTFYIYPYCKDCQNSKMLLRLRERKRIAIEYKGGSCQVCGYNKCPAALDFHHLDPMEKDFGISQNKKKLDLEVVKKELDKCILLCRKLP